MRIRGFTLAEVLITLGIIGVVVAISMPSMITSHRKKVIETKLKQTYAILSTSLNAGEMEYSDPFSYMYALAKCQQNNFWCINNTLYIDFIKPYVSNNVKEVNTGICWGSNYKCPSIKNNDAMTYFGKFVTFTNGTTILIYNARIAVITEPLSFNSKKPLKLEAGKNYFVFGPAVGSCRDLNCTNRISHVLAPFHQTNLPNYWLQSDRYRGKYTNTQMRENCTNTSLENSSRAAYCTQIYLENNFTFPKNYPIKF